MAGAATAVTSEAARLKKMRIPGQRGALVIIGGQLGKQGGERHPHQGLEGVADHEGQGDGGRQGDLVLPGRRPPQEHETGAKGDGKDQQEGPPAPPAGADAVGEDADEGIVECIPEDADQGCHGGQARLQPDDIGEEDGVKDLAQGAVTGATPIPGAINDLLPDGQPGALIRSPLSALIILFCGSSRDCLRAFFLASNLWMRPCRSRESG